MILDAAELVFLGARRLDGKYVALAGAALADDVRVAGEIDLRTALVDQADDLVGQGRIAADAVWIDGVEHVEDTGLGVLPELAIGVHLALGLVPENDVAGVAGYLVDADDDAVDGLGELAAGSFLVGEGGFVLGSLGLAGDGAPDGDAHGRLVIGHSEYSPVSLIHAVVPISRILGTKRNRSIKFAEPILEFPILSRFHSPQTPSQLLPPAPVSGRQQCNATRVSIDSVEPQANTKGRHLSL